MEGGRLPEATGRMRCSTSGTLKQLAYHARNSIIICFESLIPISYRDLATVLSQAKARRPRRYFHDKSIVKACAKDTLLRHTARNFFFLLRDLHSLRLARNVMQAH